MVYDVTNNFYSRCFILGFLDALKCIFVWMNVNLDAFLLMEIFVECYLDVFVCLKVFGWMLT